MTRRVRLALGVLMLAAVSSMAPAAQAAGGSSGKDLPKFGPGAQYHPVIEPHDFTTTIDNQWFPLKPGTVNTYEGTKDGKAARNIFEVTADTKVIDQVNTLVVFDQLFLDGVLAERTFDYYAQDDDGNVWYFGEDTVKTDNQGNLTDTSGSFRAGVDGAQPGVFMEAHPEIGRKFRQEWYKGQAEDQFKVVSLSARISVPYGSFAHALKTEETTSLEPGVLDNKYYVRGIGEVAEVSAKGPVEKLLLVDVKAS